MSRNSFNFDMLTGAEVLVVTPPPTPAVIPYASIGYLGSKLKSLGVSVNLLDLGLDALKWFTAKENLRKAVDKITESTVPITVRFGGRLCDGSVKEILNNIKDSLSAVRSPFNDAVSHYKACQVIFGAFALHGFQGKGRISPPGNYYHPWEVLEIDELQEKLLGSQDIYKDFILRAADAVCRRSFKIIAVSINHGDQLLPALGFAKALKMKGFDGIILAGGIQVSFLMEQILKNQAFFYFIDWFSPKRGSIVLKGIADFIKGKDSVEGIRNLVRKLPSGAIKYSGGYEESDIFHEPCPDFSGLPLEDYLVPEVTLPIQTATKCPWGRCKFCSCGKNYLADSYQSLSADVVFSFMNELNHKFGCQKFFFADDSTSPKLLTKISDLIIDHKKPFQWTSMGMSPGPYLTEEILSKWAKGGCRLLSLGFESGSERMLKIMNKSHKMEDLEKILYACKKFNIMTYCYGFYGHPLETSEDMRATLEFKKKYEDIVTYFTPNIWRLNPFSDDFTDKDFLGIKVVGQETYPYGKLFPNLDWDSPRKSEIKKFCKELINEYGFSSRPINYLADWIQWGHSMHIPYEWTKLYSSIEELK